MDSNTNWLNTPVPKTPWGWHRKSRGFFSFEQLGSIGCAQMPRRIITDVRINQVLTQFYTVFLLAIFWLVSFFDYPPPIVPTMKISRIELKDFMDLL